MVKSRYFGLVFRLVFQRPFLLENKFFQKKLDLKFFSQFQNRIQIFILSITNSCSLFSKRFWCCCCLDMCCLVVKCMHAVMTSFAVFTKIHWVGPNWKNLVTYAPILSLPSTMKTSYSYDDGKVVEKIGLLKGKIKQEVQKKAQVEAAVETWELERAWKEGLGKGEWAGHSWCERSKACD